MVNTRQDLDSTHACALLQAKVISIQIFWIVHFEISYIGVLFSVVEGSTSSLVVFVIWLSIILWHLPLLMIILL